MLKAAGLLAFSGKAALSIQQLLFQQGHSCPVRDLHASYLPLPLNYLQSITDSCSEVSSTVHTL